MPFFGKGLTFNKFTGSRGKSGSNDANAEYIARIRKILDENEAAFQTAELGKVDEGGGGTIAYILANYGMEVIDCGVAVQNMHAPFEVTSKADIYEAFRLSGISGRNGRAGILNRNFFSKRAREEIKTSAVFD